MVQEAIQEEDKTRKIKSESKSHRKWKEQKRREKNLPLGEK